MNQALSLIHANEMEPGDINMSPVFFMTDAVLNHGTVRLHIFHLCSLLHP